MTNNEATQAAKALNAFSQATGMAAEDCFEAICDHAGCDLTTEDVEKIEDALALL